MLCTSCHAVIIIILGRATATAVEGERESWRLERCGREMPGLLQGESKRELEREKLGGEREASPPLKGERERQLGEGKMKI